MRPRGVLRRLYQIALLALPRDLRGHNGEDITALLQSRLDDASSAGEQLGIWVGAFWDLAHVAASTRSRALLGRRGTRPSRLRYAGRALSRRPGFFATTVLTLGLALGMLTAVWTALDTTVLRPLPYPHDERVATANGPVLTLDLVSQWNSEGPGIEAAAAWTLGRGVVRSPVEATFVRTMQVGDRFFELLGPRVDMGRLFATGDHDAAAAPVAVVSRSLWNTHFGLGSTLANQTIELDGEIIQVIGVLPDDFRFQRYRGIQVWVPLDRNATRASALVRLDPETAVDGILDPLTEFSLARTEPVLAARFQEADPRDPPIRMWPVRESLRGDVRGPLWLLALAGFLVLLVASANVASLFLARAEERRAEFDIRRSLGASGADITRDVLSEALIVAMLGGALGVIAAPWILRTLLSAAPGFLPAVNQLVVDARVLVVTALAGLVTVALVSVAPAMAASRSGGWSPSTRSTTPGRTTARFLSSLVYVEVTIAMVLIVGAGLLLRTFVALYPTDPGFSTDDKIVVRFNLPTDSYAVAQAAVTFVDGLQRMAEGLPGSPESAVSTLLPFGNVWWLIPVDAVDGSAPKEGQPSEIHFRSATPNYLDLLEIELLAGRSLSPADGPSSPRVAVINEASARAFWGEGMSPIGRSISFSAGSDAFWSEATSPIGGGISFSADSGSAEWTVIGVVSDVRTEGMRTLTRPEVWTPFAQAPQRRFSWVLDAPAGPIRAGDIRAAVQDLDPGVPVEAIESFGDMIGASMTLPRFQLSLLAGLAGSGLLLAALGCFAVLSYRIRRTRREIGIRMVLGARPSTVVARLMRHALLLGLLGCGSGVGISWFVATWFESTVFLEEVSARDPMTYAAGTVFIFTILLLTTLPPGRRAASVDLAITLREGEA